MTSAYNVASARLHSFFLEQMFPLGQRVPREADGAFVFNTVLKGAADADVPPACSASGYQTVSDNGGLTGR